VVFVFCLVILFAEAAGLARITGSATLWDRLDLEFARPREDDNPRGRLQSSWQLAACVALLIAATALNVAVPHRTEVLPARQPFEVFPDKLGEWQGRRLSIDTSSLAVLKLDDYINANYSSAAAADPINLYIAYYDTQRNGAAIHSPHNCLPAGGWQVESMGRTSLGAIGPAGQMLQINRAVIRKGTERLLVYYWFQERGRIITEEYAAKWLIFVDGVVKHRTDGALVRLVTPYSSDNGSADARLKNFAALAEQQLPAYVPN
jgi:EpsI family protein